MPRCSLRARGRCRPTSSRGGDGGCDRSSLGLVESGHDLLDVAEQSIDARTDRDRFIEAPHDRAVVVCRRGFRSAVGDLDVLDPSCRGEGVSGRFLFLPRDE